MSRDYYEFFLACNWMYVHHITTIIVFLCLSIGRGACYKIVKISVKVSILYFCFLEVLAVVISQKCILVICHKTHSLCLWHFFHFGSLFFKRWKEIHVSDPEVEPHCIVLVHPAAKFRSQLAPKMYDLWAGRDVSGSIYLALVFDFWRYHHVSWSKSPLRIFHSYRSKHHQWKI